MGLSTDDHGHTKPYSFDKNKTHPNQDHGHVITGIKSSKDQVEKQSKLNLDFAHKGKHRIMSKDRTIPIYVNGYYEY